jgi:hypothetical protein
MTTTAFERIGFRVEGQTSCQFGCFAENPMAPDDTSIG